MLQQDIRGTRWARLVRAALSLLIMVGTLAGLLSLTPSAYAQADSGANAAAFVSESAPAAMTMGQTSAVSVTVKNIGTATWTSAGNYHLGSQSPQDNSTWGQGRIYLPPATPSVGPGQSVTFTFKITAPASGGSCPFQWRMVQDGVEWFGNYTPAKSIVVNWPAADTAPDSAAFVSQSVPTAMTAGRSYPASVTFKNTSNATWTSAGNIHLGSQSPQDNSTWGQGRIFLPGPVAPGQNVTFAFNVTAPAVSWNAGTFNFQWRMVHDGIAWFGDTTPAVAVNVAGGGVTPPSVGAVTGGVSIPCYGKLDLALPIKTAAPFPYLPYDPTPPPYAANLQPNEDARNGVSVDGLFLAPGQTNWSQAKAQPAFYEESFDASGTPTGASGWHLRFAPTQVGRWQYEVRVTDAGGTVTSAPAAFTCTPSASHGFVRVSPTDSRYFEFSDGTPFIAAGVNAGGSEVLPTIQAMQAAGATGLLRVWLSSNGGLYLTGGFADNAISRSFNAYGSYLSAEDHHSGRYCLHIPVGTGPHLILYPTPGMTYAVSLWVKAVGTDAGATFSVQTGPTESLTAGRGWTHETFTVGPFASPRMELSIGMSQTAHGYALVDDLTVNTPAGEDVLGGDGSFEWQAQPNQAAAAQLDTFVDTAEAAGQYLKLVCLEKDDLAWNTINRVGQTVGSAPSNAEGGIGDPNADTAVQRLQRFYARYLMARWGYATSIHSFEFMNEGGDNNAGGVADGNHYAGAQAFAAAVHSFPAMGRRLASSSCVDNSSGASYAVGFYENPSYPDIDYADLHYYPDAGQNNGAYLPFNDAGWCFGTDAAPVRGTEREPTGGPNGTGQLVLDSRYSTRNESAQVNLPTLRGPGTWTVKYFYKTSPDVAYSPSTYLSAVNQPGVQLWNSGSTRCTQFGRLPLTPQTAWAQYAGTFTLPDDTPASGEYLILHGLLTAGKTYFADVRIIAPDGRTFFRLTFDEPTYDHDSASLVACEGLSHASLSGDPSIGKPFVLGELDMALVNGNSPVPDAAIPDFARQATWATLSSSAVTPLFWGWTGGRMTQMGTWKYAGAVQAFVAGLPLSNGKFRDINASVANGVASLPAPVMRVLGQSDLTDGLAYFWVQNRGTNGDTSDTADWYNIANHPGVLAPVSATVTVPGLPDGAYQVETWDTSAGRVLGTQTLVSQGGALAVPINNLLTDAAVKITPATAPRLAVQLSADHAVVKSGDTVTYTLTYANKGTSPALGVNFPWAVPAHTQFVSAAAGGVYDPGQNSVSWRVGTVPPGGSGSVGLTVRVK